MPCNFYLMQPRRQSWWYAMLQGQGLTRGGLSPKQMQQRLVMSCSASKSTRGGECCPFGDTLRMTKFILANEYLQPLFETNNVILQSMDHNQNTHIENHVLRRYNLLKKVGSGAYGHVWKVEDRINKQVYALKKIFDAFQHSTDAQRTYREIDILRQIDHTNIIKLHETIKAENNKDVYLVFQFMEADLHNVIAEGILKEVHIRFIIYQLAKALKYLHTGSIIHRDLKPSNILVNSNCTIKLCDFGLVRSLVAGEENAPILTEGVATRWYRAPEVLLGSKSYSTPADIWSFGCIIYEILAQKPMFPGNSTVDQMDKIIGYTGFPSEEDIKSLESDVARTMLKESKIPHSYSQMKTMLKDFQPMFVDLIERMTAFNQQKRITIEEILAHEVVKPFRKKEEEIECLKEIRTSIDDNKKLSVEEYRGLIYGSRKASSTNIYKPSSSLGQKKSSSFTKFTPNNNSFSDKNQAKPEKPSIKYVRSAKDILKSTHVYNKSAEIASQNVSKYRTEQNPAQKEGSKSNYISSNFYYPKYGEGRNTVGTGTGTVTSPKLGAYTRESRPIFKTSKQPLRKNE